MSESFAALFEESQQRSETRIGEVVTAEVVRIEHNFVVVNAGLKSEAYVPLSEFKSDKGDLDVLTRGSESQKMVDALEVRVVKTSKRTAVFIGKPKPTDD